MAERVTFRRAFWTLASPVVWVANRLGCCSYKWVNVCAGARRPNSFNALWQYQWYGTPIPRLPSEVVLCGIGYKTAVAEGTVTFVNRDFGTTRITFDRDPHDPMADMWYMSFGGKDRVAAAHVRAAYAWVQAVFGGSHERRASPTLEDPTHG